MEPVLFVAPPLYAEMLASHPPSFPFEVAGVPPSDRFERDLFALADQVHAGRFFTVVGLTDSSAFFAQLVLHVAGLIPAAALERTALANDKVWARQQMNANGQLPTVDVWRAGVRGSQVSVPDDVTFPAFVKPVRGCLSAGAARVSSRDELVMHVRASDRDVGVGVGAFMPMARFIRDNARSAHPDIACLQRVASTLERYDDFVVEGVIEGDVQATSDVVCEPDGTVSWVGTSKSEMLPRSEAFTAFHFPFGHDDDQDRLVSRTGVAAAQAVGMSRAVINVEMTICGDVASVIEVNVRPASLFRMAHLLRGGPDLFAEHARVSRPADGMYGPYVPKRTWDVVTIEVLRSFEDGTMVRVPSHEQQRTLHQWRPGTSVCNLVREGQRLSDVPQPSGSYGYGSVIVPRDRHELRSLLREQAEQFAGYLVR